MGTAIRHSKPQIRRPLLWPYPAELSVLNSSNHHHTAKLTFGTQALGFEWSVAIGHKACLIICV